MQVNNNSVKDIAQKSAIISLNFRQWTGACSMTEQDFVIGEGGKMPPKAVVSQLGQKKLIDPARLRVFANLKSQAQTVLEDNGVPCCKGWLIPLTKAPEVIDQVRKLRDKFNAARDEFIRNLPVALEQWANANPEFSGRLRLNAKTKEEIERKIHADYTVCGVLPLEVDQDGTLVREISALSDDLVRDVVERCRTLQLQSLAGREAVGQRVVSVLRKLRDKLSGLSFLSGRVMPLVTMLEEVIRMMPPKGNVEGRSFVALTLAVSMLSNPDVIDQIINGKASFSEAMHKADSSQNSSVVFGASQPASATSVQIRNLGLNDAPNKVDMPVKTESVKSEAQTATIAQPELKPSKCDDLFGDLAEIFGTQTKTSEVKVEIVPEASAESDPAFDETQFAAMHF